MIGGGILFVLSVVLSVAVKYGLPWLDLQPTPTVLALLVAGPAVGMALWLLASSAVPPKNS